MPLPTLLFINILKKNTKYDTVILVDLHLQIYNFIPFLLENTYFWYGMVWYWFWDNWPFLAIEIPTLVILILTLWLYYKASFAPYETYLLLLIFNFKWRRPLPKSKPEPKTWVTKGTPVSGVLFIKSLVQSFKVLNFFRVTNKKKCGNQDRWRWSVVTPLTPFRLGLH